VSATGPAATLHRLWAVARLTLLEAVRRRVFVLLLLFGAAIVSSAAFFPAIDAESRLRLIEVWSVRASLLFSVIVSIFLAGFSLPGDFETRRVYTLVTKPLHRTTLFAGKFVGFFLLLAIFLGVMAVISIVYIRIVAVASTDFPPLKAEPRWFAQGLESLGKVVTFKSQRGERIGVRAGAEGAEGALVWKFSGLDREAFADPMKIKLRCNLGRRGQQFAIEGRIQVRLMTPQTGASADAIREIHTNQETEFAFDRALVGLDGRLDVVVAPAEPDLSVDADAQSVVLYGASWSFEVNYLRGMLLVLFQSAVVMGLTLAGSTFLTAPVSIVLGVFLYIIGMMWGNIAEGVRDIDVQMEHFRQMLAQGKPQQAYTPEDLPPWILEVSTAISKVTLKAVPDFSQYNFSDYLLADHAVMGRDLADGFLNMLTRVVVLLAFGLVAMMFRELAA